ncbi:hypothetical protein [Paraburkholderia sp. BR14320]|uniref:hypothetical protein n=1 Tax=unclassified Paraburkholderia TaxID=2615204 RepID=UPI0034CF7812
MAMIETNPRENAQLTFTDPYTQSDCESVNASQDRIAADILRLLDDIAAASGEGSGDDKAAASGEEKMTPEHAAGTLSSYMGNNGWERMEAGGLYWLAENTDGNVPPDVSKAAKFMMQNPDVFRQIETHERGTIDGVASGGELNWAAMGGLRS